MILVHNTGLQKSSPELPTPSSLQYSIDEFLKSLQVSEAEIRKIEKDTNGQRNSSLWYNVRRYRLTASRFGEVFHRRVDTRSDALMLRLLQQKQIFSPAIEWGIKQEPTAIAAYIQYQHDNGKSQLTRFSGIHLYATSILSLVLHLMVEFMTLRSLNILLAFWK